MIGAIVIGLAAGVVAGLLGVGGGVLFVPGLVLFLGLNQHQAEATSLLAIVPVAIVGTYRQDRYGNVCRADALPLGLLSLAGAAGGRRAGERPVGRVPARRVRCVDDHRRDPAGSARAASPVRARRRQRRRRSVSAGVDACTGVHSRPRASSKKA